MSRRKVDNTLRGLVQKGALGGVLRRIGGGMADEGVILWLESEFPLAKPQTIKAVIALARKAATAARLQTQLAGDERLKRGDIPRLP